MFSTAENNSGKDTNSNGGGKLRHSGGYHGATDLLLFQAEATA
jgi:hypothetical protein